MYGFIEKRTADGILMFNTLKDGKTHAVTLELYANPSFESGSNCVLITKFLSDEWLIKNK